jgi:gas vesicle protein
MSKGNKNLLVGVVIGVAAGFVAGVILANSKGKKVDALKSKITNLAVDAQERINALRAMVNRNEERTEPE